MLLSLALLGGAFYDFWFIISKYKLKNSNNKNSTHINTSNTSNYNFKEVCLARIENNFEDKFHTKKIKKGKKDKKV